MGESMEPFFYAAFIAIAREACNSFLPTADDAESIANAISTHLSARQFIADRMHGKAVKIRYCPATVSDINVCQTSLPLGGKVFC